MHAARTREDHVRDGRLPRLRVSGRTDRRSPGVAQAARSRSRPGSEAGGSPGGSRRSCLSAGSCIDWLREDLGLITTSAETDSLAASRGPTAATSGSFRRFFGIGTPVWDFGARGAFLGITRGTGRAEMVRAVLEGIAHRGMRPHRSGRDRHGDQRSVRSASTAGMSANVTFLQASPISRGAA